MFLFDLFLALIVAGFWSLIFRVVMKRRGYRKGLVWLFLLLFFGTWAAAVWVSPFGPSYKGTYWAPFIVTGVLLALIFASALPLQNPKSRRETLDMLDNAKIREDVQSYTYLSLNITFWIIIIVLALIIVLKYFR